MDSYFRLTSYALVATSVLALALTGNVDAMSIVLYGAAWGFCYWRDAKSAKSFRLREWMWRVLAILYVPLVFADAVLLSGNKVKALVHMTMFLSAAKLMQSKRDRDWVFLYLIAFFQMLLAAGLTFNATFVASLGLFLFFFVSTLAAFEIRRASQQVRQSTEETITRQKPSRRGEKRGLFGAAGRREPRVRYLVGASIGQIAMVALLTLPLFFLIPRFAGGAISRGGGDPAVTGFSNQIKLGTVAKLKTSPRVVMRVQLDKKPGKYLRWRGIALDSYEDRTWRLTDQNHVTQSTGIAALNGQVLSSDSRVFKVYNLSPPKAGGEQITQRIVLEPLDTQVLFAARKAVAIQCPMDGITHNLSSDAIVSSGMKGRTPYVVTSDIRVPNEDDLRTSSSAAISEEIKKYYLQLPKLDNRIGLLAHEVTRNEKNAYDKAKAIELFLKGSQFKYTLDLKIGEVGNKDPLAEFLFDLKEGHCEYFASAMVILLRTLGIPARIVNGFQMGEFNEINDYYTVRESDAHSWVEVYFPSTDSWVEFDPTPSAGINDYTKGGLISRLRKYADALEVFWLDYIVTLDQDEQISLIAELQHRLVEIKDWAQAKYFAMKDWARRMVNKMPQKWGTLQMIEIATAIALLGMGTLLSYVAMANRKRRGLPPTGYGPWWYRLFILPTWKKRIRAGDHIQSAVLFYEQMLLIARRGGLTKQTHQTPMEFATVSNLSPIVEITSYYNKVRFGGSRLRDDEARRISHLLSELRDQIRARRK